VLLRGICKICRGFTEVALSKVNIPYEETKIAYVCPKCKNHY
jgi:DNA polymerase II large subunit